MTSVFISYSHKDRDYVIRLKEVLETYQIDTWIDTTISVGEIWPLAIQHNIDACVIFIVVMTPRSFESEWVQNEVTRAKRLGKQIYPLLLEGDNWIHFETRQYLDVRNGTLPEKSFFEEIKKRIEDNEHSEPRHLYTSQEPASTSTQPFTALGQKGVLVEPSLTLKTPRDHHLTEILRDGRVFIAGGKSYDGRSSHEVLNSTEIYDFTTDTLSIGPRMKTRRYFSSSTLLPNGTILITGGVGEDGMALASAEIYNPISNSFSDTRLQMTIARRGHISILMQNGKVLICGGDDSQGTRLTSAEIFDPVTGKFSSIGNTKIARLIEHTSNAILLKDGRVLIAGGYGADSSEVQLASIEIYDPDRNVFEECGTMTTRRAAHTLSLLPDGKVLIAGGHAEDSGHLNSTEIFVPATSKTTLGPDMKHPHFLHTAIPLSDGRIVITGGFTPTIEIYNPEANSFSEIGSLKISRYLHTAVLLGNNKILIIGGANGAASLDALEWIKPL